LRRATSGQSFPQAEWRQDWDCFAGELSEYVEPDFGAFAIWRRGQSPAGAIAH
jgi:hypothetical protein